MVQASGRSNGVPLTRRSPAKRTSRPSRDRAVKPWAREAIRTAGSERWKAGARATSTDIARRCPANAYQMVMLGPDWPKSGARPPPGERSPVASYQL